MKAGLPAAHAIAPGLLLAVTLAVVAGLAAHLAAPLGVGAVAFGVFLGVIVGNAGRFPVRLESGVRFAASRFLQAAVVLLGLQIAFADVRRFGLPLLVAVLAVALAVLLALVFGRLMGVPPRLALLIGAGTGVCGVSAIAAVRPLVRADEAETTYAIGAITLLGSIGLILFPLVQLAWHPFSNDAFGILSGGTLHSVPQAVGAGFAGGGDAGGALATVTKLTRVVLLMPLLLALILLWARAPCAPGRVTRVPVEVWGFVALVVVGNLLPVPDALRVGAAQAVAVLLVVALTALGLLTRLAALRHAGSRPALLALAVWGALVVAVGVLVRLA